jgi:hypothetical protein
MIQTVILIWMGDHDSELSLRSTNKCLKLNLPPLKNMHMELHQNSGTIIKKHGIPAIPGTNEKRIQSTWFWSTNDLQPIDGVWN